MNFKLDKPDVIGVFASVSCIVHCVITPFLFFGHTLTDEDDLVPIWWQQIDYIFLIISFISIYRSVKTTNNNIINILLWLTWGTLCFLVMNEKIDLVSIPEFVSYSIAFGLAGLHLYNMKYCQCETNKPCLKNG